MFSQKGESADGTIDTLIGPDTTVTGDVRFKGGLHVDGRVDGSIVSDGQAVVVVSDQGSVSGRLEVPTVIVDGVVDGDIVASEKVELREHARVSGNIRYGSIQMAMGAQVNGELMSEHKAAAKSGEPAVGKLAESSR